MCEGPVICRGLFVIQMPSPPGSKVVLREKHPSNLGQPFGSLPKGVYDTAGLQNPSDCAQDSHTSGVLRCESVTVTHLAIEYVQRLLPVYGIYPAPLRGVDITGFPEASSLERTYSTQ